MKKSQKREHNDLPAALAVTVIVDVLFLSFLSVYTNQMPLVFLKFYVKIPGSSNYFRIASANTSDFCLMLSKHKITVIANLLLVFHETVK